MDEKPLAFVSLIEVLEKAVGRSTSYELLEPFSCSALKDGQPAIVEIQNAGKIIAEHVGLTDLTFIIAVTLQEPSTAGHIELRYGSPDVFVEISRDVCMYSDAVLATLCHEICHKFLHTHGIRHGIDQIEQEYLTDVAAVYLGMGKIMLNGCECQSVRTETQGGRTTTTTRTLRVGYISRECLAFVYRMACQMRQIPPEHFRRGLSQPALEALASVEWKYGHWFRSNYHTPEGIDELARGLREQIADIQTHAATKDQTLRTLVRKVGALDGHIRDSHKFLYDAEAEITRLQEPNDNPHLRYLNCIATSESVTDLTGSASCKLSEHQPDWDRLDAVTKEIESEEENNSPQIVECPMDKTKLRVPGGRKRLLVTCSSCKYKFFVNTAAPPRSRYRWLHSLKGALGFR